MKGVKMLYKAKVTARLGLRVRAGTGTWYKHLRSLKFGDVVNVYEEKNGWCKISPTNEEWSMGTYLEKIETPDLPPLKPLGRYKAHTNALYVHVREGAGFEYKVVGKKHNGEEFDVYTVTSNWVRISPNKSEWMYRPLVKEVKANPPANEVGELSYLYFPFNEEKAYRITQLFGKNPGWYTRARGHNGIDYSMFSGERLYAAREGTVIRADYNPDGYGRSVWIKHYDKTGKPAGTTIYGHLTTMAVKVGDVVSANQYIGTSGGGLNDPYRGFSTGAHLHFEYRWDKQAPQVPGGYTYNAVDPLPLLRSWDLKNGIPLKKQKSVKCNVEVLLIRVGPSTSHKPINKTLLKNQTADVYEEKNGWYRINPVANEWVMSKYTEDNK